MRPQHSAICPTDLTIKLETLFMSDPALICYICLVCGYVYDPEMGDPTQSVDPNTSFDDVPDDWVCPLCYVEKSEFEPLS